MITRPSTFRVEFRKHQFSSSFTAYNLCPNRCEDTMTKIFRKFAFTLTEINTKSHLLFLRYPLFNVLFFFSHFKSCHQRGKIRRWITKKHWPDGRCKYSNRCNDWIRHFHQSDSGTQILGKCWHVLSYLGCVWCGIIARFVTTIFFKCTSST